MATTDTITQARLKELLRYDPETGLFTWLQRTAQRIHIGDVAGSLNPDGYIYIGIDGVTHLAHRLVFLYVLGWMPEQADHDDHIRDNNRWKNLNPATHTKNMKNKTLNRNNTSGHCGVCWVNRDKMWRSQITINRKIIYLGCFINKVNAIAARKAADIKYGFHPNHGL